MFWKCLWTGSHISYGQGGQKPKLHVWYVLSFERAAKALYVLYWQVSLASSAACVLMVYKLEVTCTCRDTKNMTAFPFDWDHTFYR